MNHQLHDLARTVHNERYRDLVDFDGDRRPRLDAPPWSLRSAIGNTLIRAGTRLVPRADGPGRVQTNPPC